MFPGFPARFDAGLGADVSAPQRTRRGDVGPESGWPFERTFAQGKEAFPGGCGLPAPRRLRAGCAVSRHPRFLEPDEPDGGNTAGPYERALGDRFIGPDRGFLFSLYRAQETREGRRRNRRAVAGAPAASPARETLLRPAEGSLETRPDSESTCPRRVRCGAGKSTPSPAQDRAGKPGIMESGGRNTENC